MSENEPIIDNKTQDELDCESHSESESDKSDFDYGSDAEDIKTAVSEIKNMRKELDKKVSSVRNLIESHVKDGDTALYWLEKYINLSDYCEVNDFSDDGYIDLSYGEGSDTDALISLTSDLLEPFFNIGDIDYSDEHISIDLKKKKKEKTKNK